MIDGQESGWIGKASPYKNKPIRRLPYFAWPLWVVSTHPGSAPWVTTMRVLLSVASPGSATAGPHQRSLDPRGLGGDASAIRGRSTAPTAQTRTGHHRAFAPLPHRLYGPGIALLGLFLRSLPGVAEEAWRPLKNSVKFLHRVFSSQTGARNEFLLKRALGTGGDF